MMMDSNEATTTKVMITPTSNNTNESMDHVEKTLHEIARILYWYVNKVPNCLEAYGFWGNRGRMRKFEIGINFSFSWWIDKKMMPIVG